jgi:hypothetical protein
MALDASASIEAANSLEKMLAHQLPSYIKAPWNKLDERMAPVRRRQKSIGSMWLRASCLSINRDC